MADPGERGRAARAAPDAEDPGTVRRIGPFVRRRRGEVVRLVPAKERRGVDGDRRGGGRARENRREGVFVHDGAEVGDGLQVGQIEEGPFAHREVGGGVEDEVREAGAVEGAALDVEDLHLGVAVGEPHLAQVVVLEDMGADDGHGRQLQ